MLGFCDSVPVVGQAGRGGTGWLLPDGLARPAAKHIAGDGGQKNSFVRAALHEKLALRMTSGDCRL